MWLEALKARHALLCPAPPHPTLPCPAPPYPAPPLQAAAARGRAEAQSAQNLRTNLFEPSSARPKGNRVSKAGAEDEEVEASKKLQKPVPVGVGMLFIPKQAVQLSTGLMSPTPHPTPAAPQIMAPPPPPPPLFFVALPGRPGAVGGAQPIILTAGNPGLAVSDASVPFSVPVSVPRGLQGLVWSFQGVANMQGHIQPQGFGQHAIVLHTCLQVLQGLLSGMLPWAKGVHSTPGDGGAATPQLLVLCPDSKGLVRGVKRGSMIKTK